MWLYLMVAEDYIWWFKDSKAFITAAHLGQTNCIIRMTHTTICLMQHHPRSRSGWLIVGLWRDVGFWGVWKWIAILTVSERILLLLFRIGELLRRSCQVVVANDLGNFQLAKGVVAIDRSLKVSQLLLLAAVRAHISTLLVVVVLTCCLLLCCDLALAGNKFLALLLNWWCYWKLDLFRCSCRVCNAVRCGYARDSGCVSLCHG